MFNNLNEKIYKFVSANPPWTNVYGLARTILALATALTLIVNDASTFFRPSSGTTEYPFCRNNLSIFCLVPNDYIYLDLIRWICIFLLLLVASGWRPRFTGLIHWWIAYSLNVSAVAIDGGEQITSVITLMILPITLLDPRKWHWQAINKDTYQNSNLLLYTGAISLVFFLVIRIQVAIVYFNSTVAKFPSEDWLNGTAVYYYIQDPMLGLPPVLLNLLEPIIQSSLIVIPTWGTLVVQILLFLFLLAPKRYWKYMFYIALIFHELIALMLGLVSFSLAMLAALILYLRPIEDDFSLSTFKRILRKDSKSDDIEEEVKSPVVS